jgi:hypothetical protein
MNHPSTKIVHVRMMRDLNVRYEGEDENESSGQADYA